MWKGAVFLTPSSLGSAEPKGVFGTMGERMPVEEMVSLPAHGHLRKQKVESVDKIQQFPHSEFHYPLA